MQHTFIKLFSLSFIFASTLASAYNVTLTCETDDNDNRCQRYRADGVSLGPVSEINQNQIENVYKFTVGTSAEKIGISNFNCSGGMVKGKFTPVEGVKGGATIFL